LITNPVNHNLFVNFEAIKSPQNLSYKYNFESKKTNTEIKKFNLPVFIAALGGTFAALFMVRHQQGKKLRQDLVKLRQNASVEQNMKAAEKSVLNFLNINPTLKALMTLTLGSVAGGIIAGTIQDKGKKLKNKLQEGFYQMGNQALPASIVIGGLNYLEKHKTLSENKFAKFGVILAGLGIGTPVASILCNKINSFFDKNNEKYNRTIHLKDFIVHVDDIAMALILARVPFVHNFGLERVLPLVSLPAGYEAGNKS